MTIDWQLDHVGIVLRNIDDAVKHYQRLGIALLDLPQLKTFDSPGTAIFVQNGAIRVRLIQPAAGKDLFNDYLDKYGEGVYFMEFRVNDLPGEKARLIDAGFPVMAATKRADGSDMEVLFDTRKYGNVALALYSEPASFPIFRPSKSNWRLWHLGFAVKDIHKFAEQYQSIGFKMLASPYMGRRRDLPGSDQQATSGGTPTTPRASSWMCHFQNRQGSFLMAANQLMGGEGHFQDFLAEHGEGVEHIHFLVGNLNQEMANMVDKGFPVISSQTRPDGTFRESFYDTRGLGVRIALWGGKPSVKARPESRTGATKNVYEFYERQR